MDRGTGTMLWYCNRKQGSEMDTKSKEQSKGMRAKVNNDASPCPEGFVATVWQLRCEFQHRWKRSIIILLTLGLLISVVTHLIMAVLLGKYGESIGDSSSNEQTTVIEFAVFDSETLSELPQETALESAQSAPADLNNPLSTETVLEASATTASVLHADQSMVATLGSIGGGDLGTGMGGSGGAGTSFFGIASKGGRFCYIMDISASMLQNNRLSAAISELRASLLKLPNFSQFYILFYSNDVTEPPTQHGWNTARRSTLTRIVNEIQRVQAYGGTKPAAAFKQAMSLRPLPEVIFFLTDGQIPRSFIDALRDILPKSQRVVVHAVAFGDSADVKQLKAIAKLTGGQYKFVKSGSK